MFVLPLARVQRASISPSFSRAMDRLFDESFDRTFARLHETAETRTPMMDVSETDAGYIMVFDLPGATRKQLMLSVDGRRVVLSTLNTAAVSDPAEVRADHLVLNTKPRNRLLYRERSGAPYQRTVVLPVEVDQATSHAKFDNGTLTLTLPKRVPGGTTQISIG